MGENIITVPYEYIKHRFLEITYSSNTLDFPCLNPLYNIFQKFTLPLNQFKYHTDFAKWSPLFTNGKKKPLSTRKKTNVERLNQNGMFVLLWQVGLATIEPNHRLSRPSTAVLIVL